MVSARFLTLLPIIMGLSTAALMLFLVLSLSAPLPSLSVPSQYSLPAIKSTCLEYVCSMWSLLHQPLLISSRNLFLLVNIIILFLLISLHLHQHSAPAAAGKSKSRDKKHQHTEKLIMNDQQAAAMQNLQGSSIADDRTGSSAAATVKEALSSSSSARSAELDTEESLIAEAAPMQENSVKKLDESQELPTVDRIIGPEVEQIVLEEDGRLRLICRGDTKGSDAEESEGARLGLIGSLNGSDAEKIVVEEDEGLKLVELIEGSDVEKIVLEEDGRLRLIDRPQVPSFSRRPRKSYSTGDKNVDESSNTNTLNGNQDTGNLSNVNYDMQTDYSLGQNDSNLYDDNNNGILILDLSSSPSNELSADNLDNKISPDNLNHADADHTSLSNKIPNPIKRTRSRPMRVKKADSLDATWKANNNSSRRANKKAESLEATWKAINSNKGSAANNSRDHKHLIRQSSRQDFKPNNRGLMRASNNSKVRREPSISQDELNAKVESFIARFNEQIRIQRQESLVNYMQMVDRGSN